MQKEVSNIEWLEFDLLAPYPHIVHGVFLRHGGSSKGDFNSLNLGLDVGDHPDNIKVNREAVSKALNLPQVMYAHQTHGKNIHRVKAKNGHDLPSADALYTTDHNVGLAVTHADCQAAIFYDPVHEAVAVAHAGWKGLSQNIFHRLIETLHLEIGTQSHNLIACIAPSLGPDHAEYKNYKQDFPQDLWGFQEKPNYFNFWQIAEQQLLSCGLNKKNIEISKVCTHCHDQDYFSYRRDKHTGRHATIVAVKG